MEIKDALQASVNDYNNWVSRRCIYNREYTFNDLRGILYNKLTTNLNYTSIHSKMNINSIKSALTRHLLVEEIVPKFSLEHYLIKLSFVAKDKYSTAKYIVFNEMNEMTSELNYGEGNSEAYELLNSIVNDVKMYK